MDKQYITERFINTCIREDVYGLLSDHAIIETEFDIPHLPEVLKQQKLWLEIASSNQTNWLPIVASDYMQYWQLTSPMWLQKNSDGYLIKHDYQDFVSILKQLSGACGTALDSYLLELDCATEQRALARQGIASQLCHLERNINGNPSWSERLLYADQVARIWITLIIRLPEPSLVWTRLISQPIVQSLHQPLVYIGLLSLKQ